MSIMKLHEGDVVMLLSVLGVAVGSRHAGHGRSSAVTEAKR